MSSSPITNLLRAKTGTTISDLVSTEHRTGQIAGVLPYIWDVYRGAAGSSGPAYALANSNSCVRRAVTLKLV
jgi:hypothetical protein